MLDRVKESMVASVRVVVRIWWLTHRGVFQAAPLYACVLSSEINGIELCRVSNTKDVADIVGAVDLVEADECLGAPDADDGFTSAGEEVLVVVREEQAEDTVSVGLDGLHELVRAQGPHGDLAIACRSKDVFVGDGD